MTAVYILAAVAIAIGLISAAVWGLDARRNREVQRDEERVEPRP